MRPTRRSFLGSLAAATACIGDGPPAVEQPPPADLDAPKLARPAWRVALGPTDDLRPDHAAWLSDADGHSPPEPRALAVARRHVELPQTVIDYLGTRPNPVTAERRTLVLCPIGSFPFDVIAHGGLVGLVRSPPLDELAAVLGASFGLPVELLPPRSLETRTFESRTRNGVFQIDAHTLLRDVAPELPSHAYAMLALVNADLFATPEQHYAFGWSMHRGRLGVASFARFDPSFHGGLRPDDLELAIRRRSVRLLAHELAHMFGLTHCTYFRCLLGPVDVLDDLDALAVHLCPVCQCKLLRGAGVDPIASVRDAVPALDRLGLVDDAAWAQRRLAALA